MEEEYQMQQVRLIDVQEWREVRSFLSGPRWPVMVAVFTLQLS